MSTEAVESTPARPRVLDFWKEDEVWFRDWIRRDRPWGDETLLEKLPKEAEGHFGVKVGEFIRVDGQGYRPGEIVIVESREELRQLVERMKKVEGLILPWFDRLVLPSLWLPHFQPIHAKRYRAMHGKRFLRSLAITIGLAAVGFYRPEFLMFALLGAVYFGLFPLVDSAFALLRRVERLTVSDLNASLVNDQLFQIWLLKKPTTWLKIGVGVLAVVFALQTWVDAGNTGRVTSASLQGAALVRDSVLSGGEWWRLITTGLMHGNVFHILFNGMALFSLGRVIVALVSPSLLGFVFLLTVITGSLASLWLGSASVSVGASGGILGLLGFLLVVTHKFKGQLPDYLQANLIQSTIVVAIFGLLGARFIDNAAHAGGLVGGVILGLCCLPAMRLAPSTTRPGIRLLGWASIVILLAGVGKVVLEIWPS